MAVGDFPESLSQDILAGIILVGEIGRSEVYERVRRRGERFYWYLTKQRKHENITPYRPRV